jgi:hypothetical protein
MVGFSVSQVVSYDKSIVLRNGWKYIDWQKIKCNNTLKKVESPLYMYLGDQITSNGRKLRECCRELGSITRLSEIGNFWNG